MVYIVKVFIFAIQKLVIMQLAEIVSVTGMPGIFQVKGKRGDGLIVTSLVDGKSQFVSGRVHMFSTLDNITIYTTDEPVALKDVLAEMKKQEGKIRQPIQMEKKTRLKSISAASYLLTTQ